MKPAAKFKKNNSVMPGSNLWWKLSISPDDSSLVEKDKALLSPHIINLRVSSQSVHELPQVANNISSKPQVDFIYHLSLNRYSLLNWANKFKAHYPISDLTLVYVLEIVLFVFNLVWLPALYFFIQLHDESRLLIRSIVYDINNYWSFVGKVILFPKVLFKHSHVDIALPTVINYDLKPKQLYSQTLVFAMLVFLLILPLKGIATLQNLLSRGDEVISIANSGFLNLEKAGSFLVSGDIDLAHEQLADAQSSFSAALAEVNLVNNDLAGWLTKLPLAASKLATAKNILLASQEIAKAASIATDTIRSFDVVGAENPDMSEKLNVINSSALAFKKSLVSAREYLSQVNEADLPLEYRPKLSEVLKRIDDLEGSLSTILTLPSVFESILTDNEDKTYVVVFQNTSELRPTGGFGGSLALIKISHGQVVSVDIPGGGPYDFQGSLKTIIKPPDPIRLIRGTWQLQDANWFFDFPTSARKIIWFIKESQGPEINGVIALNSDVVVDLLKLTGPIELSDYDKVLTADNFMRETQAAVEIEYDRSENRPKQFIADLAPILFNQLFQFRGQELINLTALVNNSLINRDIQLYSTDSNIQDEFIKQGWSGQVIPTTSDYLAIVRTNIGGGKTDSVIREKVDHTLEITPTGELIARVRLSRSHLGDPRDTFESRRNVTYVRFYVPLGSNLISTSGFTPPLVSYYRLVPDEAITDVDLQKVELERGWNTSSATRITEEYNKTVFGNWLSLSPGETKTSEIVYQLPFTLKSSATWQDLRRYTILFQRQSGVKPMDFSSAISWPDSYRLRWQETSSVPLVQANKLEVRSDWQTDEYYGILLERK